MEHGQPVTIREWQSFFGDLFADRNRRESDGNEMMIKLMSRVCKVQAFADGKRKLDKRALAGIGSRIFTLAVYFGLDIATELLVKHPHKCTRCGKSPCECEAISHTERRLPARDSVKQKAHAISLQELATMLWALYGPGNEARGLQFVAKRMGEEAFEVCEALDDRDPQELAGELADVFAWWIGALKLVGITNIQEFLWEHYPGVCAHCSQNPCKCP